MRAQVVTLHNPFDHQQRQLVDVRRPVRVRRLAPQGRPVIARLNGRWILRAEWRRKLRDGDHLAFHVLPEGGGQDGGSNPLQMVLSLALLAFAPMAAAALLGTTTALVGTTLVGQITTAGIMMAGSALVSAVVPAQSSSSLSLPTPSPTYSLTPQGNSARLEQPIPVQYGRMRFPPDFAAQPYTEFSGSDQYIYQLFCIGQGEYEIERIQIDDTDLDAFTEITTEVIPPGGAVTLFPAAVVTSTEVGGQELLGQTSATYIQSDMSIQVTETAHGRAVGQAVALDFQSGAAWDFVATIASTPTADTYWVSSPVSLTTSGNVRPSAVLGGNAGYVVSGAGQLASRIALDVVLPRGLFDGTGSTLAAKSLAFGVEIQGINDDGVPVGPWVFLAYETILDATTTPIRRSYSYPVAPGRYAVRAWRTDVKDTGSAVGHEIVWSGLRAYLQETSNFGNVTLLAMRAKASNNLSLQASRMVQVTATRKLPMWDGTSWSAPTATRSIAWAIADAARNSIYGAGRADAQIDLAALLALDWIWFNRRDVFDGRFDQPSTFWDAVTRIAAAGRAKPFLQGGVLRVVRDGPATVPVALFSMRNIVKGSFSVDYLLPSDDTADAVQVAYYDGTTWAPQRVTATLPGSASAKPIKVSLFGVTVRAQALREGTYLAACNRYRRRIVKFATEMDGFIPSIGDLIAVQHDMAGWGVHAEALSYDPVTRTLQLSEPVTFTAGTHYLSMRRKDGSISGPWVVRRTNSLDRVVFAAVPDYTPYTGSDYDRTHCVFGQGSTWSAMAKVLAVKPKGAHLCDIEAVIEDPAVHTAEVGLIPDPITLSTLPKVLTRPAIRAFMARLHPLDPLRVLMSWEPVAGAASYHIEMAEGSDLASYTGSWTRVADTTSSQFTVSLISPYRTLIRIRAVGLATGDWTAAALGSLLSRFWSTDPAASLWTSGSDLYWRPI